MTKIPKGVRWRMTKAQKAEALATWSKWYTEEYLSIREIAIKAHRSYGTVWKTLSEGGVTLRSRGGHPREQKNN